MIIARSPLRVSFFGGGTDHPTWFKRGEPASVISTTIDKYIYIQLREQPRIFNFDYRVVWRIVEECKSFRDIQHPIVRTAIEHYHDGKTPLDIVYNADLPSQSGLGSSSSFTVSMLNALHTFHGQRLGKQELAEQAIHVEQNLLQEPVGSQDQVAAAYGGLNQINFNRDGGFTVEPMKMRRSREALLEEQLLLFFTGFTRSASAVEAKKIASFDEKTAQLRAMHDQVLEARSILLNDKRDIREFGELLHTGWEAKRALSEGVSTGAIDDLYATGRHAGALGGKLLGAGGGGFLLFFVEMHNQAKVRAALEDYYCVDFRFDREGSRIVVGS